MTIHESYSFANKPFPRKLVNASFLEPGGLYKVRHFNSALLEITQDFPESWANGGTYVPGFGFCLHKPTVVYIKTAAGHVKASSATTTFVTALFWRERLSHYGFRCYFEGHNSRWPLSYLNWTLESSPLDVTESSVSSTFQETPQTFVLTSKPRVFHVGPFENSKLCSLYECRILYEGFSAFFYSETRIDPATLFERLETK